MRFQGLRKLQRSNVAIAGAASPTAAVPDGDMGRKGGALSITAFHIVGVQ